MGHIFIFLSPGGEVGVVVRECPSFTSFEKSKGIPLHEMCHYIDISKTFQSGAKPHHHTQNHGHLFMYIFYFLFSPSPGRGWVWWCENAPVLKVLKKSKSIPHGMCQSMMYREILKMGAKPHRHTQSHGHLVMYMFCFYFPHRREGGGGTPPPPPPPPSPQPTPPALAPGPGLNRPPATHRLAAPTWVAETRFWRAPARRAATACSCGRCMADASKAGGLVGGLIVNTSNAVIIRHD